MWKPLISTVAALSVGGLALAADLPNFQSATRVPRRPDAGKTIGGKSIAEVKKKVEELWPTIVFEKNGKPVEYVATFDTDAGPIVVEFFPDVAPSHVRSMIALIKAGYYDGLIFHRVIPGFMIQGGCPLGTGTGGPGYELKQEFNGTKHVRGILSTARSADPDSGGSQFFLMVAPAPHLDENYTVFGKVVKGMDAVDRIVDSPRDRNDRPNDPPKIKKATVTTK